LRMMCNLSWSCCWQNCLARLWRWATGSKGGYGVEEEELGFWGPNQGNHHHSLLWSQLPSDCSRVLQFH
jgi:hypothetical protein